MSAPQTKGILLAPVVADVLKLVEDGRISREDLVAELGEEARKVVQDGVSPVSWYAAEVYRDLARVLMKLEGKGPGDFAHIQQRGERAGKRLVESGLYQQIQYLRRTTAKRGKAWVSREDFERSLRLIVSMQASLTKGGTWTVEQDPAHADRVQIVLTDVEGMPEETAHATCGILSGISLHGGSGFAWRYERPAPDRIVYRMDRDLGALGQGRDDPS
jgi:hypothetical protein